MTAWHCINLGDALVAEGAVGDLQRRFERVHRQRGCPADMALYIRHVPDHGLHCAVEIWFTPAAAAFAEEAGARPCPPPPHAGLGLLAGDGQSATGGTP